MILEISDTNSELNTQSYSINTYSVDWILSRFLHNYVLYPYSIHTLSIQPRVSESEQYNQAPQS